MYDDKKISFVIPCYNEEEGLERILRDKPLFVDEVIVVDNNSTDTTPEVAKKYGAILIYEEKRGYGYAYQAGLPAATGDIIVTLDGDSSYPVLEVEKLLWHMKSEDLDFLVGCRHPIVSKDVQPLIKKIANHIMSWLIRVMFGINFRDTESGMMIFNKDILDKIKLKNAGMGFSHEIKIKAFLDPNIKCGEAHISYLSRVGVCKFRKIRDSIQVLSSFASLWIESIRRRRETD